MWLGYIKTWPPAANQLSGSNNIKSKWPTVMKVNIFTHLVKMSMCTNFCKNRPQGGEIICKLMFSLRTPQPGVIE